VCSHSQEDFFEFSSFEEEVDTCESSPSRASRSLWLVLLGLREKGTGVLVLLELDWVLLISCRHTLIVPSTDPKWVARNE
jgi:hypothetical protein